MLQAAHKILEVASDKDLATALVDTFVEVEKNFFLRAWKTSELDSGHFVEAARRFVEFKLFGTYTPIGKTLPRFDSAELSRYEKGSGLESYRIHVPRCLLAVYGMRNKRGVGHLGSAVTPNYLDATFILASCKWVLGEFLRAESKLSFDQTVLLVEQVIDRPIAGVWEVGQRRRILDSSLPLKQQTLFLLFAESPQKDERLAQDIGCSNLNNYRRTLRHLHSERLIEYAPDGTCHLSPSGRQQAEQIVLKQHSSNP